MKPVRVQALKDHEWAGRPRKDGEIYEADTEDNRFNALLAIGLAKLIDEPEPQKRNEYRRRDLRAEK